MMASPSLRRHSRLTMVSVQRSRRKMPRELSHKPFKMDKALLWGRPTKVRGLLQWLAKLTLWCQIRTLRVLEQQLSPLTLTALLLLLRQLALDPRIKKSSAKDSAKTERDVEGRWLLTRWRLTRTWKTSAVKIKFLSEWSAKPSRKKSSTMKSGGLNSAKIS